MLSVYRDHGNLCVVLICVLPKYTLWIPTNYSGNEGDLMEATSAPCFLINLAFATYSLIYGLCYVEM